MITKRSQTFCQTSEIANVVLQSSPNIFSHWIIQFLQIQSVLENTGEENQEDLVKLRDDLVELIHVSEGI